MKQFISIGFFVTSLFVAAQGSIERHPEFPSCVNLTSIDLENCFYQQLYQHLYQHYQHPSQVNMSNNEKISMRFEVDKNGAFIPIHIDARYAELKNAMKHAFDQLPQIKAPTYNGRATYMQFIVSTPVPMIKDGEFKIPSVGIKAPTSAVNSNALDSIAFAKANQEYDTIISNQYDSNELKSEVLIPLSYQRYSPYEAAMNRIGNNAHTAVKPYSFNYVNNYYDLEAERKSLLKDETTWLGKKWWNEHFFEVAGKEYWFVLDPGVDLQLGKDTSDDINTFNNTRLLHVSGGIGKQITFGASIQESQGRFAGYFNREIELRAPDGGNPGIVPGRGIAEDGGDRIYDYPVATGYINYTPSKYFNLQLGHGQHFIGDGYRSLILSDNSQPFPYAKVNARFWKIDYSVLYTSLRDVRPEVTADDSFRTKFMVHHYLSWNATKRLNIGLFESVLWQDDNQRGFDFNYINPIIFYQTIELETGSRGGNALIGATAKYKFTDRVTAYAQLVLDEFSGGSVINGNGSYQNKSAYQLGVKYQNAFKVKGLMLQAEYNRVRPYTYSHNTVVLNYANSNQALAHPWGANFYETTLIGRYIKNRWYAHATFTLGERGYDILDGVDNANYGGNIYRSEDDRVADNGNDLAQGNRVTFMYSQLEAGYIINPASRLQIYGQFTYRNFDPHFETGGIEKNNTTWFNLGLRTDIMNWSFNR